MGALATYIPFLHPIGFFHTWSFLLLIPMSFGIAVIYKALRMTELRGFWRAVAIMTVQVVLAMVALGAGLIFLVQIVVPMLPLE